MNNLTERQQKLLASIKKMSKDKEWLLAGGETNFEYRNDLHVLWSDGLIEFNQAGTHIKLVSEK